MFIQIHHINTAKNKLLNYKYTIKTTFYYMHTWLTQLTVIVLFYHCKEILDSLTFTITAVLCSDIKRWSKNKKYILTVPSRKSIISCKQSTLKSVPVVGQVIPLTGVLVKCMLPLSFLLFPMYYPINLKQKHNLSN